MKRTLSGAFFLVALVAWPNLHAIHAQEAVELVPPHESESKPLSKTADFIRMTKSEDGTPQTLDTAVISYVDEKTGVQVDLVGAVHIGEASYYDELNKLFDQYDVLLYELVAPEGTVLQPNMRQPSDNPISMLQNATKNFLGMESQLEKIDYSKAHFVRADMTPEQMTAKMRERGENMLTLAMSAMLDMMRKQNQSSGDSPLGGNAGSDMNLMEILQSPKKAKLMMAQQFAGSENLDLALGGPLNQLLVVDRNAAAVAVLKEQLTKGHRKLGIFYGAAHLPDLEMRLIEELGVKKTKTQWIKAWDLTTGDEPSEPLDPISVMLNLLKEIK